MDFKKFNDIIDNYIELRDYANSLANTLIGDGNDSYDDSCKFYNAADKVCVIKLDIQIITERLWALGELYDLLYDMETEKDKFSVLKRINNQKDFIRTRLDGAIKYIREVNLIDYRVIDFSRDFKNAIENTNIFLENL